MELIKKILILLLLVISPLYSQEKKIPETYEGLIIEYEILLNDFEGILKDYEKSIRGFSDLKTEYDSLSKKFEKLTDQHSLDIKFHEETKLNLLAANRVIENLETSIKQLLSVTDSKYFAFYPQVGYSGNVVTGGIGFTAQYPKFPVSLIIDLDYIHNSEFPLNIQVGLGFRF